MVPFLKRLQKRSSRSSLSMPFWPLSNAAYKTAADPAAKTLQEELRTLQMMCKAESLPAL